MYVLTVFSTQGPREPLPPLYLGETANSDTHISRSSRLHVLLWVFNLVIILDSTMLQERQREVPHLCPLVTSQEVHRTVNCAVDQTQTIFKF